MNPIKAGSNAHPTGQRLNVSLALATNKHKWQRDAKLINDIIEKIPSTKIDVPKGEAPKVTKKEKRTATLKANKAGAAYLIANADFDLPKSIVINELDLMRNAARYEYQVDASLMDSIMQAIDRILERDILGGSKFWTTRFFLNSNLMQATADGTTDSFNSALNIVKGTESEASLALLNVQQQLNTPQYNDRLRLVNGRVFEGMLGLVGDMKSQLRLTLTEGMARGVGIRDLKGMINKRLGIGMGRAERIARTEINVAYRTAYLDEAKELNEDALKDDPWMIMQAHRSALSMTTRPHHAARHGTIHTIRDQKDWWLTGSNSIQCLCSTLDVLVNRESGEVLQDKMIEGMLVQKEAWFPS